MNIKSFSLISTVKDGHKETDVMNDLLMIYWTTAIPASLVHFFERICKTFLQEKITSFVNYPVSFLFPYHGTSGYY